MAWALLAFFLLGAETWHDTPIGCGKDTDCKGDRICENARCVSPPPAQAARDGQKVLGELPMAEVRKVVDANMGDIQRCYEAALIRNPRLDGKVTLEWTIGSDGSVTKAGTKLSTLNSNEVIECMRTSLMTWRFPAPKGGVVVVSYPFLFKAAGK